jgi:hypothetical protein
MSRTCQIALLAMAAASAPALAAERVTYTEGVVFVDRSGVHAQSGRAELVLPDGASVHLDVYSDVQVDQGGRLFVRQGRVAIRTTAIAPWTRVALPTAGAMLAPGGAYSLLFDPIRRHLLVTVSAGRADIESPRGGTSLVAGQRAIMFDGSGAPVPTTFTPARDDSFEQWSQARLARAAVGTIPGPRDPHPGFASPTLPAGAYDSTGAYGDVGSGIYVGPGYSCGYSPCGGVYSYGGASDYRGGHRPRDPYAPDFTPRFFQRRGDSSPDRFGPRGLEAPVIPPSPPPSRHQSPRPELPPRVAPPPKAQASPPPPSPSVGGTSAGMRSRRSGAAARPATPPPSPGRSGQ